MRGWNAGRFAVLVAAATGISACAGGSSANGSYAPVSPRFAPSGSTSPIRHVIVVIQENRSFDNLFATFPGADGATTGQAEAVPVSEQSQCPIYHEETVNLTEGNLAVGDDFGHKYSDLQIDYDNANMDGFDVDPVPAGGGKLDCLHPYQYVNPAQIAPYWDIAEQYVLADHMFQTQGSGSFTAHQDLIAGGTAISPSESIIDDPSGFPWGCDAPPGATTSLITTSGNYEPGKGPFPCFTQYETLRDRLDAAKISWKYYSEKVVPGKDTAGIWNAFDAISAVRYGAEWGKKVTFNDKLIFRDISKGTASRRLLGDARRTQLRSPARTQRGKGRRLRPVVGGVDRQRGRAEQVLEEQRDRDSVGRLGRILRSRAAGVLRRSRRPGVPRPNDDRIPVRARNLIEQARLHIAYTVRNGQHREVHRTELGFRSIATPRHSGDEHRRCFQFLSDAALVQRDPVGSISGVLPASKAVRFTAGHAMSEPLSPSC